MPYSLISKPQKLSEMFQDKKNKKKAKKQEPRSVFSTGPIIAISVILCTLLLSLLASSQTTTSDLADFQKESHSDQVSIRVGEGVTVAQLNTDGELITDNPAQLKADITIVTTPDTEKVCEGSCSTSTELELFDEARVYIEQDSVFQIHSLDFDNNNAKFSVDQGHIWVRAPRNGQIQINAYPYTITLTDRAVADLDILTSQVTINQVTRFSTITHQSNNSSLQLTARQTAIIERGEDTIISNVSPRTFQDLTLEDWDISRMTEERAWLKSQQSEYSSLEFSSSEVNSFLKDWFSFLIISDEERASAKFANLDNLLKEALADSSTRTTTMREFKTEALLAANSSEEAVLDYLLSRWEKLRYVAPHTIESGKAQDAEYIIKTKIEDTYAAIAGSDISFQWERIYLFEDFLSEFSTTSALAVLEQYHQTLVDNISTYDTADLNAQLLYLENLFSANTVYIYEDFWNTLFEIEYSILSQLKPAEATAFGTELIIEKIKQVGYLWLGTDKYDAYLVANTIMGEFIFTLDDTQIKYNFFRDNYDDLVATNAFVSVIFDENDSIIEKAMNYQTGKNEDYTITEDDIFAMEFYQEYISYLENKPDYYQRPPTVSDVVNQLTELGLTIQSGQISSIPGWIELANLSSDRFDLSGWFFTEERIANEPTRYSISEQVLDPNERLVLGFDAKSLSLPADGNIIYLYDADENLIASLNYPYVPKGLTYSLQNEGYYGWTQATPSEANDRLILPKGTQVKSLDGIVISEVSPLDEYRFTIANIKLDDYKFDAVYDYALNVFSEIGSDADTLSLISQLAQIDSDYASDEVIYYNDAIAELYFLPTDFVQLFQALALYPESEIADITIANLLPNIAQNLYTFVSQSDDSVVSDLINTTIAANQTDTDIDDIYITHTFTFNNFLALPDRLDAIAAQDTYHASSTTSSTSTSSTSLQILQTLIRDQLLVHEIYLDISELTNCDTETYTSCQINNAWILNPEDSEKVYFSFVYDIDTNQATDITMQRENYFVADSKKALSLRQSIISANNFLNQVEEVYTIVEKELNNWSIQFTEADIQYTDETLQEFKITNARVSYSGDRHYFSAVYDAVGDTLRQIKFDDGKIFNRPLTQTEFETLAEALYDSAD